MIGYLLKVNYLRLMQNPLIKKLQIKNDHSLLIADCPAELKPLFDGLPAEYASPAGKKFDVVLLFAHNELEILEQIPRADTALNGDGLLWLGYPKQSGSIPSELSRDKVWEALKPLGFEPVRLISLNHDWSCMRLRKAEERKKASKFAQDPPGVDRNNKTVIPPGDLQKELDTHPEAKAFFDSLAFSHKREYVGWIHEAKKEETRIRRVQKTIELLLEGKKTK